MTELTGKVGFASAVSTKRITRCRIVGVELIATMALVVCLIIAVTAVSIGMARADVLGSVAKGDSAPLAIAIFIGLLFTGMGGLTALMARDR